MTERKIRAGYYRRYDGKVFYLVTTAKDLETGEETVILRPYAYGDVSQYYTMSREDFSGYVEMDGKRKFRYRRLSNMIISEEAIENLEEDGLRGPIRKEKRDRDVEYIVLGCTHYPFIRRAIAKNFGRPVTIIDGSQGTARQLRRQLQARGWLTRRTRPGTVVFQNSDPEKIALSKTLFLR